MNGIFLYFLLTAMPANPSLDDFCHFYSEKAKNHPSPSPEFQIANLCEKNSLDLLTAKSQPAYNFRSAGCDGSRCSIFRSGQITPANPSEEERKGFRERQLGFTVEALKDWYQMDEILNLRFDPKVSSVEEAFGAHFPRLPLSSGEVIYSFDTEKRLSESLGMKIIYMPSPPEMEHFVNNYVPRLDKHDGISKPYVCRLPKNIADGESKHWLEEHAYYLEHLDDFESKGVFPVLTSANQDCSDWEAKYGKEQVATWLTEVKRVASTGNFIFQSVAKYLIEAEKKDRKVLFHCSSGTDRVGRVGVYYNLYRQKISADQVRNYKGPFSDAEIDLVIVNYLLSNRAGSSAQFINLIPDITAPDSWVLTHAFDE